MYKTDCCVWEKNSSADVDVDVDDEDDFRGERCGDPLSGSVPADVVDEAIGLEGLDELAVLIKESDQRKGSRGDEEKEGMKKRQTAVDQTKTV